PGLGPRWPVALRWVQLCQDRLHFRPQFIRRLPNRRQRLPFLLPTSHAAPPSPHGSAVAVPHVRYALRNSPEANLIVVDAVRIKSQVDAIREAFGSRVLHVHLTAPTDVLARRYQRRSDEA